MNQKGLTSILILILIAVLGISGSAVYNIYSKTQPKKLTTTKQNIQKTPAPTKYPIITLKYIPVDLSGVEKGYFISFNKLFPNKFAAVSCLKDTDSGGPDVFKKRAIFTNSGLAKYITEIENHLYIDEEYSYKGNIGTKVHTDSRSKREISFSNICKLNDNYYFTFEGYSENIHRGGGSAYPSHFAFTDKNQKLTIIENTSLDADYIKLPPSENPNDYSIPTVTYGTAYYGCRGILAANETQTSISCGGGDGPGGSSSIFLVDLVTQKVTEKVFCSYNSEGKYKKICYDQDGKIYYSALNSN